MRCIYNVKKSCVLYYLFAMLQCAKACSYVLFTVEHVALCYVRTLFVTLSLN